MYRCGIETKNLRASGVALACFNSTTVQLIPGDNRTAQDHLQFQFHNGTINTEMFIIIGKRKKQVSIPQRYN